MRRFLENAGVKPGVKPMLKYKGYTGYVVYDDNEARIFHGEVVGLRAVITFQGTTVEEIEQAFKDSID